jgi:hypothetical protein
MRDYAGVNRDVIMRDVFRLPIRWHRVDLDCVWEREERRVERLIHRAVGDYYKISRPPNRKRFPSRPHVLDLVGNPKEFLLNRPAVAKALLPVHLARDVGRRLWLTVRGSAASRH